MVGPDTGVSVIDASDPAQPRRTAVLRAPQRCRRAPGRASRPTATPNSRRHRRSVAVRRRSPPVYDVKNCAQPRLLNDGGPDRPTHRCPSRRTRAGSPRRPHVLDLQHRPGLLSAVDLSNPHRPRVIAQALTALESHGIGVSPDGFTLYLSHNLGGLSVWDVRDVQLRRPNPQIRYLGGVNWTNGWATQHSIPVTHSGKPFLSPSWRAARVGSSSSTFQPPQPARREQPLKLEINLPKNQDRALASSMAAARSPTSRTTAPPTARSIRRRWPAVGRRRGFACSMCVTR